MLACLWRITPQVQNIVRIDLSVIICGDDVRDSMPLFRNGRGGSNPTSPLQLTIRECSMYRAQELNALWHSVLPITDHGNLVRNTRAVAFWADHEDIAYAVAIWTTPIAANRLTEGNLMLELRRLAISEDAPKNTASRMLSVMRRLIRRKWPELVRLVSYQATEHHEGTIYKAAGWLRAATSEAATWHEGQSRAPMQTESSKVRWELSL